MRVYLDPKSYLFSEQEWLEYGFVDRLQIIIDLILELSDMSSLYENAAQIVALRCPSAFQEIIWKMNPFSNEPEGREQYRDLFMNKVLPTILRSVAYCPDELCDGERTEPLPQVVAHNGDEISQALAEGMAFCSFCGDLRNAAYAYVHHYRCLELGSEFFQHEIDLKDHTLLSLVDIVDLFPTNAASNKSDCLAFALKATLHQMALDSTQFQGSLLPKIRLSASFIADINNADMRGRRHQYVERILQCIVQIATGIDLNAKIHSMHPQTIVVDKIASGKWNAYVFKMGISDQDRRCSRIYFGYLTGGVYLHSYDPDAH